MVRCPQCQRVQPVPADPFAVLGVVPRTFDVDLKELHRRFLHLQRLVHPDTQAEHAAAGGSQGACGPIATEAWSAAANRSYQQLREPISRARILLPCSDAGEGGDTRDGPFLEWLLEQRERLHEASPRERSDCAREWGRHRAQLVRDMAESFRSQDQARARRCLDRLVYVQSLLDALGSD